MPRRLPDLAKDIETLPPLTSRYVYRVPTIMGIVGGTGSGKSYLALSLIKLMRREGTITKLYLISPSAKSNVLYKSVLGPQDALFEDLSVNVFKSLLDIEKDVEALAEAYRKELEYAVAYKKYTTGNTISYLDENLLELHNYRKPNPTRPAPCIFLDDAQNSAIYSNSRLNPWSNLVLRCRHMGSGIGCSIIMICQGSRGIPRNLRTNLTNLILFGTQSKKERQLLYEEISGICSEDEFNRLLHLYTLARHGYMHVDILARTISDSI
jgi:ABC-type dipeptide/oligopeptide/nickel transport system ATPase component